MIWYSALLLATGAERIAELAVSSRNARWSFAHGGVESGRRHFPPMVALHIGLLVACFAEAWFGPRPFLPALGLPMLGLVALSQGLRWWCIGTLGARWNTRVIVVPGLQLVGGGPYRWFRHPNYVAVVIEGIALPLVHTAWATAVVFTVANAVLLLCFRIPTENRALALAADAPGPVGSTRSSGSTGSSGGRVA